MIRGKMIECKCAVCGEKFMARVADRNRGWAKCCSKSCAATLSNKKTELIDKISELIWFCSKQALEDEEKAFDDVIIACKAIYDKVRRAGWQSVSKRKQSLYFRQWYLEKKGIEKARAYNKRSDYWNKWNK